MHVADSMIGGSTTDSLRVLTCGSVDDGKSTLIGRLMLDIGAVPQDILIALSAASAGDGSIDLALIADGLMAEREQGITIDVGHIFFSTGKRSFVLADCPGHEQYTRNMMTGASHCDAAIVLINAEKGVTDQTKRHSFLLGLLGIKHIIVAVNKMDRTCFSEERFSSIVKEYAAVTARLGLRDVTYVPTCAVGGDNVSERSKSMPWYGGSTLLHSLENIQILADRNFVDVRFPVQLVHKDAPGGRSYAGTLEAGILRPGDEVVALPSGKRTAIKTIETFDGQCDRAFAGDAVAVRLRDDIDLGRGDMLTSPRNMAHCARRFECMLVWLSDEPSRADYDYDILHTTKRSIVRIENTRYRIDIDTFHRERMSCEFLRSNDIARCVMRSRDTLTFDAYERNRATGSFIMIDRVTRDTVAAGVIIDRLSDDTVANPMKTYPVFWLTGNTGAGKSTLAFGLRDLLRKEYSSLAEKLIVLDGDTMREAISECDDLSPEGRRSHNLRIARLARELQGQGFIVMASVIAPFESVRSEIASVCDPKWVYVKRSLLPDPGKPYEVPQRPDYVLDHDRLSPEESIADLQAYVIRTIGA